MAKALDLFIGQRDIISEGGYLTTEEIQEIFEANAKKLDGYSLLKSKRKWWEWLPFFKERILMAKNGIYRISTKGLAIAIMALNSF